MLGATFPQIGGTPDSESRLPHHYCRLPLSPREEPLSEGGDEAAFIECVHCPSAAVANTLAVDRDLSGASGSIPLASHKKRSDLVADDLSREGRNEYAFD
jgi:hypothetical protein